MELSAEWRERSFPDFPRKRDRILPPQIMHQKAREEDSTLLHGTFIRKRYFSEDDAEV
jgi:hypothetical protein